MPDILRRISGLTRTTLRGACASLLLTAAWTGAAQAQLTLPTGVEAASQVTNPGGVTRLRQAPAATTSDELVTTAAPVAPVAPVAAPRTPYVPGEFERFVQRQAGAAEVRRFGADLITGSNELRNADISPVVPGDYVLAPGDEVLLTIWGSVDADLRLVVDRAGRIAIPRVGSVQVAGVRHDELPGVLSRRVGQVFRNFELSVSLGQLRGLRVFVTGFVDRPGVYTVSSLSTVLSALMKAGGPAASGSFRNIELRRGGQTVATLDLYDLLTKGDRKGDRPLQAGDVVHVGPVGAQVAVIGSVNKPAVLELKSGESVADALRFAGGFSAVADRRRLAVERLEERESVRIAQLSLPADGNVTLSQGDLVRAFSAVDAVLPTQKRSKRVRIEGEVLRPADYVLPESSTLEDALKVAGGLTPNAYVFGTEFTRESVRQTQQENYERALRDLETDFTRASTSIRVSSADEVAAVNSRSAATARLVERLRSIKPVGRVVLSLQPDSSSLPPMALEDGDRIYVPSRATTVGVFGSVFNAASYVFDATRSLGDYVRLAGGPTKGADEDSIFVVRANGQVVSNRQKSSWVGRNDQVYKLGALPGDTVFVPEEMNKTTWLQVAKDWTQILFQFGVGAAGIKSAVQ